MTFLVTMDAAAGGVKDPECGSGFRIRFFTPFRMTACRGPEGRRGSLAARNRRDGGASGRRGTKKRRPCSHLLQGLPRTPAVTYSPTLPGSTIGAGGLNGSVRYGKRWIPAAIATGLCPAGPLRPAMPLGKTQAKPSPSAKVSGY